ncbi:MAG: L-threonylcarbamoyladenylate synthase [Actinomyces sp.]|uniref:L-threonylcarbamoyladenylate synthase n=1 Tax=Actinomyces sp. TaxID=29317 RepID=UPI0026DD2971|nr:L-threonylcarbamoyladenylate synthase [Actinomyces sp.]MDO4242422.1 L-threonylcarbamoyladenylate synthase [Actinomyces sp.]
MPGATPGDGLDRAVAHLNDGGLLLLPTDTVYGIGAAAADSAAVARLLAAKGRGRQMPPPVLIASVADLTGLVARLPAAARDLAEAFWPGGLTLVLPVAEALGWDLGETEGTIAVRMPDHPLALKLLRRSGPLAVTSANRTGRPPATDAAQAAAAFGDRAEPGGDILLLDGGPTPGPVPSTIVSVAGDDEAPRLLREGVLSAEVLEKIVGPLRPGTRPAKEHRRPTGVGR